MGMNDSPLLLVVALLPEMLHIIATAPLDFCALQPTDVARMSSPVAVVCAAAGVERERPPCISAR